MDIQNNITKYFTSEIRIAVQKIYDGYRNKINEYRFRTGRPLAVSIGNETRYLSYNGELTCTLKDNTIILTQNDILNIFEALCQHSVHSFSRELANGFITIDGGNRVGICGTNVSKSDGINTIKYISGLNFRVARQVLNCSDKVYDFVFSHGLCNVLIAGAPSSGKTTILRDLCRRLGKKFRLSVIDERSEIAAVHCGVPQNDVGINTDVFDGYSKICGIETAVRVMSPQAVVCDEIGNIYDSDALNYAHICGVKIIAAVHADNIYDVVKKNFDYMLFDYIVFLSSNSVGEVNKIIRTDEIDKDYRLQLNCNDNGNDRELLLGRS